MKSFNDSRYISVTFFPLFSLCKHNGPEIHEDTELLSQEMTDSDMVIIALELKTTDDCLLSGQTV